MVALFNVCARLAFSDDDIEFDFVLQPILEEKNSRKQHLAPQLEVNPI